MSLEFHEITIDITIFQANVSGRRLGLEESSHAEALIPDQDAGRPRQIQLPAYLARQRLGNLGLEMRKPQRPMQTQRAVTRRKHEAQIGILAPGVHGALRALALRAPQIGAILM